MSRSPLFKLVPFIPDIRYKPSSERKILIIVHFEGLLLLIILCTIGTNNTDNEAKKPVFEALVYFNPSTISA